MKNGCLFIVLIFLCLFLMCTVKVADKLEKIKPSPCVPLPEPKPIPIIKVPQANSDSENEKPVVEPINENQSQSLPEPARIPIVKSLNENKVDQIQNGHWETRVGRGGFLGLRTYKYKVWVKDGSTNCKDGSCK